MRCTFNAPNCTDASAVIVSGTCKTWFACVFTRGTRYMPYPLNANMDLIVTGTIPASSKLTSVSEMKFYYTGSDSGGFWGSPVRRGSNFL